MAERDHGRVLENLKHPVEPAPYRKASAGVRLSLTEFASLVETCTPTLERLFAEETGLTYRRWRARLRLLATIERLEQGDSTTEVALSLGYSSTSAFTANFREEFGEPPRTFLRR